MDWQNFGAWDEYKIADIAHEWGLKYQHVAAAYRNSDTLEDFLAKLQLMDEQADFASEMAEFRQDYD